MSTSEGGVLQEERRFQAGIVRRRSRRGLFPGANVIDGGRPVTTQVEPLNSYHFPGAPSCGDTSLTTSWLDEMNLEKSQIDVKVFSTALCRHNLEEHEIRNQTTERSEDN